LTLGRSTIFLVDPGPDCSVPSFGSFFHFAGKFFDALAHHLSGLEFYGSARGNDEATSRLIWVATNPRFGEARLKDAKVAQLDSYVACQAIGDLIQRSLNDIEDLVLHHPSLVADRHDNVAFCELAHLYRESSADPRVSGRNLKIFTAA
jgi:hypothetical protein